MEEQKYKISEQEYFEQLAGCQEQYNKAWDGCTHEDTRLGLGWL